MAELVLKARKQRKVGRCEGCNKYGYVTVDNQAKQHPEKCPDCKFYVWIQGDWPGNKGGAYRKDLKGLESGQIWAGGAD